MKKNFFVLIFLLSIVVLPFNNLKADTFIPSDITFSEEETPVYNAGQKIPINFLLRESDLAKDKTFVEYGVAREIVEGRYTSFEPIKVLDTVNGFNPSNKYTKEIEIPNILDTYSTSTYVFYAKIMISDDADNGTFIVSDNNFKIVPDKTKTLIRILNMNLLQSNGQRFPLLHGPTIYDLSKYDYKNIASSTSLEITFVSNIDISIYPIVNFNKLRSDVKPESPSLDKIELKKGSNTITIPLPVFDYNPGVYQGKIMFNTEGLMDADFQYIVAGDSVTFGNPSYISNENNQTFTFDIYGTPIDFSLEENIDQKNLIYDTEFVFLNKKGKELYKITQKVDFSTSTFSIDVPADIKNISNIYIKTLDQNGKVIYEDVKDSNAVYENNLIKNIILLTIVILISIIVFLVFKKHNDFYIRLIVFIIYIATIILFGREVFATTTDPYRSTILNIEPVGWNLPRSNPYLIGTINDDYNRYFNQNQFSSQSYMFYAGTAKIRFNENITTKQYPEDKDVKLMFRLSYVSCLNDVANTKAGFSTVSREDALKELTTQDSIQTGDRAGAYKPGNQTIYVNMTQWRGDDTHDRYVITLPYRQINLGKLSSGQQNNVFIHHATHSAQRDYYDEYKIPLNITKSENTVNQTCTCNNRTQVCTSGTNSTSTPNSPACALKSSCSVSSGDVNNTYTIIPINGIGSITYTIGTSTVTQNNTNPYVYTAAKGTGTQTITATLRDAFDNQTSSASCYLENTVTTSTTTVISATTTPPTINLSKRPSVTLNKNGQCTISWVIENLSEGITCKLTGTDGYNQQISGSGSKVFGPLTENQRYTITCSGGLLTQPVVRSETCRINPEIIEN